MDEWGAGVKSGVTSVHGTQQGASQPFQYPGCAARSVSVTKVQCAETMHSVSITMCRDNAFIMRKLYMLDVQENAVHIARANELHIRRDLDKKLAQIRMIMSAIKAAPLMRKIQVLTCVLLGTQTPNGTCALSNHPTPSEGLMCQPRLAATSKVQAAKRDGLC